MQKALISLLLMAMIAIPSFAQKSKKDQKKKTALEEMSLSGLKFRSIGPAVTSGRISDIAIHPDNPYEYIVASSSGGVWHTNNSGTTFTPVFDGYGSYSIGCVTYDSSNPDNVWVGTGENNNQRSVAYGDGIYKSTDGGMSWENIGLKNSEHIGKIIVHPENSDIVWVAAIGPLWSSGGDRGVYMTVDGGKTWEATLTIDKHTGVTDLVIDPQNPNILYAAAFQRARHVFTYLGGGPGSSIYKSVDGGLSWNETNSGLPGVDLGRIGLAISPVNPDLVYAIVEAAQGKSGFYASTNGGMKWEKRGSYVTSGNYYQEIIADPLDANTIYGMDTWMHVSHDGGRTFKNVGEDFKHVDNHSMWIDSDDNRHWIVGCDGGIYETWDAAKTWDFKANLPVVQFYKVSVDNDAPFYNIYGGTQDNFSLGGPSRTTTSHGIVNSDWYITHGGDGFETQIDPENPDIVYAQSQYGVLVRYDRKSGEELGIQPKERKGENSYRWNWDAPLQVSNHKSGRVYFAANKLFRSDDYGNSWEVISDDLTRQINRNELKIMDRVWSMEAVAKNRSTSPYGTLVAFSESPLNENLLIVGSDDGLIHITEDGGTTWRKVDNVQGAPIRSYVNAVWASKHDENVMYAAINHHKYGDFKPYLFRSQDKGRSWRKISSNLPDRGSVYAVEEDHVEKDLLFVGTEFGVFFSPNGGIEWKQLKNGVPTIAVRDLAIQHRENDLVLGTFGRGFYVLDDYSPLRNLSKSMTPTAGIMDIRDAQAYEKSQPLGLPGKAFQGDGFYTGEDLGPVAMINYFFDEELKSLKDKRREKEKEQTKNGVNNVYPSLEELESETDELSSQLLFTITDGQGKVVRKILTKPSKGLNRINWDLRYAAKDAIDLNKPSFYNPFAGQSEGSLVGPGTYTVTMSKSINGEITNVGTPMSFKVSRLDNRVMPSDNDDKITFQRDVAELSRSIQGAQAHLSELRNKMRHIKEAIKQVELPYGALYDNYQSIETKARGLSKKLNGDSNKTKLDIGEPPTPATRIGWIEYEQKYSTSAPTKTHMDSYAIAKEEFRPILDKIRQLVLVDIKALEKKLEDADAPYTPGREVRLERGF